MDGITKKKKVGAVLVQGGGIAGTQASLDLANAGYKVYLLDRSEAIGGMMARLDKTFPTGDCATCISSPKFVECARNLNIDILTLSEMESLNGEAGNFHATVKRTPRFVNEDTCTGCGDCAQNCPVKYQIYPTPEEKVPVYLEEEERIKVNDILDQYKESKGALMPVLKKINSTFNYLPENILKYVSQELDVPLSLIYRIATFYSAFSLTPRGRHIISVCAGTTCYVRGASGLISKLQDELHIEVGETTRDKKFTLTTVRCLGCCSLAPVISVDGEIFGNLKEKEVREVLSQYE
jgi:NADH:ubiquinone oxidoreductase subunit E